MAEIQVFQTHSGAVRPEAGGEWHLQVGHAMAVRLIIYLLAGAGARSAPRLPASAQNTRRWVQVPDLGEKKLNFSFPMEWIMRCVQIPVSEKWKGKAKE